MTEAVSKKKEEKEVLNTVVIASDIADSIIIPKRMSKLEASKELALQHAEEENLLDEDD